MSRREQQASRILEARTVVEFTPIRDDSSPSLSTSPLILAATQRTTTTTTATTTTLSSNNPNIHADSASPKFIVEDDGELSPRVSSTRLARVGGRAVKFHTSPNAVSEGRSTTSFTSSVLKTDLSPISMSRTPHRVEPTHSSRDPSIAYHIEEKSVTSSPPEPSNGAEHSTPLRAHIAQLQLTLERTRRDKEDAEFALAEEIKKRNQSDQLLAEISVMLHERTADLERERRVSLALRDELAVTKKSLEQLASAQPESLTRGRPSSVPVASRRVNISPFRREASTTSAASKGSSTGSTRTTPNSITRPTISTLRRGSPQPTPVSSRNASPGATAPVRTTPPRCESPVVTRQKLAAASFLRATASSAQRTTLEGASGSHQQQAARPRLHTPTPAQVVVEPKRTAVVMRNGVVVTGSVLSGSAESHLQSVRKVTPVRDRLEQAIASKYHSVPVLRRDSADPATRE